MTAKNRADIQTEITSLLANNTTGDISPTDVRTVHETSKDSNLNLLDAAGTQTVTSLVEFAGGLTSLSVAIKSPALRTVVNVVGDLPAAIAGVITLATKTEYVVGDDFTLGTDRLVLGVDTVFRGIDENVVTVTYAGTGNMFTFSDVSGRLKGFTASCTSGTFIDAKNTAGSEGTSNVIIDNVDIDCDTLGSIENLNIFAMFRSAILGIATQGFSFVGAAGNAITINDTTIIQAAGNFLNLGTATFLSFDVSNYLMIGSGGTGFLNGAAGSANIRTGGLGRIIRGRDFGAETILTGVTVNDALWDFQLNDKIQDTRPDGLLSMQGNATPTTIVTQSVGALVAGTWIVQRSSQVTGTAAGRFTYDGGKDATLPITISLTIEPVSGGSQIMGVVVARDGVVDADSLRQGTASPGNPASITVPWQDQFSTTEFTEVFVTNESGTTNVLVSSGTHRLN